MNTLKQYKSLIFKAELGKPREKMVDFLKTHPHGTYIVSVRHDVTTVIDGYLYDTWDCDYLTVYTAWEILA